MNVVKKIVGVAAVVGLVISGVSITTTSAQAATKCSSPVLIGAAMAQTGFMSPFDGPAITTARIEVAKINASGGVLGCKLVLKAVDSGTDPAKAAQIATTFVSQGAKLLLVTCDADLNYKSSLVGNTAGVLVIAPCVGSTAMGPNNGLNLGFSMGSAVPGEAAIMAEYAFKHLGRTATLFKDMSLAYTTSQCDSFATRFKQLGGTVKSVQQFNQTQAGHLAAPVDAQVAAAKADGAKVIALCSYPGGGAEALAAIRKAGLNTAVISGFGMDGAFWLGAVPHLSNFYDVTYASVFGDDPSPAVKRLLAAYKVATGSDAATGGFLTGAASIDAFAAAAKHAHSFSGAALAKAMEGFRRVATAAGPTSFSSTLHVNVKRPMAVIKVTDGVHKFLSYETAVRPVL